MFVLACSFLIPVLIMWRFGFVRVAGGILVVLAAIVIAYVSFIAGLVVDWMFFPSHLKDWNMPGWSVEAYVEWAPSMGALFLVPYILVWDLIKMYFHFSFTTFAPIVWMFQIWGLWIIGNFGGVWDKK